MARQSTAAQRNLTATEELEKLEQSITLTLQEIDHNFSRAHRIVTTSILPKVDEYAEHSSNVWEGSKFWKQFFEASANVSLSGYEEPQPEEETMIEQDLTTATTPSTSAYRSPPQAHGPNITPQKNGHDYSNISLSPSPAQSTPRPVPTQGKVPRQQQSVALHSSPYESLKREVLPPAQPSPSESTLPFTPQAQSTSSQHHGEPQSSPFVPPSTSAYAAHRTPANDILLHRVLDKNWRIQATPHGTARLPSWSGSWAANQTPKPSAVKKGRFAPANVDDLDFSPALAAPELHAEIFESPGRRERVPGVSVLTPACRRKGSLRKDEPVFKDQNGLKGKGNLWDSDSEEEHDGAIGGMSPPKTMQFHIPPGRLIRTPAREASKRIVEDLLLTAGGNVTDDFDEDSPSVVKRGEILEEDTF